MASAWDKTDVTQGVTGAPKTSAWDTTPSIPQQKAPVEDPGIFQSALIGAGHTFDRVGKGMQQLYYGARSMAHQNTISDLISGGNEWDQKQKRLAQSAADDEEAYNNLKQVRPFSTGIGETLPSMILPGGGGATLGTNMARMAVSGALPASLSYGSLQERAQGAMWGGAVGAVAPLVGAGSKTLWAAAEPFRGAGQAAIMGRTLNRVAGDDAAQVISKLRDAKPVVPGSFPTAAQVAENGGIAALERSAAAVNPTDYTTRQLEQAAARKAALSSIAGTPQQMADAISAREAAVSPLYNPAKNANYIVDDGLQNLTKRPMVQDAMAQAKNLAENQGRPFSFNVDPSNPFSGLGIKGNPNTYVTGSGLQDLKMAMDGMLSDPTGGFAGAQGATLKNLRGQVIDWMENANPAFKDARTTYASMSKPINQMQIGQQLSDNLSPALSDFGALGKETGAKYAQALRNAEQTAKSATGFPGATLDDVMNPQQMGLLNGIGTDLARASNAQTLGRGAGSDTIQKLAMQNIASQSGMPSAMGAITKVGGKALDWVYSDANQDLAKKLASALLNPQDAADYMSAAAPTFMSNNPTVSKLLQQGLLRSGFATPAIAASLQDASP